MKNIEVSVIVPVYNVEKYLDRCILSILQQSYNDYELILVNDGSRDNSAKICDSYAKLDERIVVKHQKNAGVSVARNTGLEVARGEYIVFVDADDYLEENCLEILIRCRKEHGAQLVCGSHILHKSLGRKKKASYAFEIYDEIRLKERYLEFFNKVQHAPWGKLYERKVIEDNAIRFQEGIPMAEDSLFNLEYYEHINCAICIPDLVYDYNCTNINSAMGKGYIDFSNYLYAVYKNKMNYIEKNQLESALHDELHKEKISYFEWCMEHYIMRFKSKEVLYACIERTVDLFSMKNEDTEYKDLIKHKRWKDIVMKWKRIHWKKYYKGIFTKFRKLSIK